MSSLSLYIKHLGHEQWIAIFKVMPSVTSIKIKSFNNAGMTVKLANILSLNQGLFLAQSINTNSGYVEMQHVSKYDCSPDCFCGDNPQWRRPKECLKCLWLEKFNESCPEEVHTLNEKRACAEGPQELASLDEGSQHSSQCMSHLTDYLKLNFKTLRFPILNYHAARIKITFKLLLFYLTECRSGDPQTGSCVLGAVIC